MERIKKLERDKFFLKQKLRIKTKALWFASGLIQENLQKDKTQEQIYEMLKAIGKDLDDKEQENGRKKNDK